MFIIAAILTLSSSFAFADTITLTDISGQTFEVEEEEVINAYNDIVKAGENPEIINKTWDNSDGTVTIVNPRFRYAGRQYRIFQSGYSSRQTNADFMCRKLFGYRKLHYYDYGRQSSKAYPVVVLNYWTGEFSYIDSDLQTEYFKSITCKR